MSASKIASECWFVTGPTAAGKTPVGLALAALEGEVISLDSMALYRGMDIGTAKPSIDQRREVPHHLIDVIDPHETFSLAQYVDAAQACVDDLLARCRRPIFVGGTPLYLKGLLRGIFAGPPADWQFRREIEAAALTHGADWLHARVREVDSAAAERLHPQDTKRLIRALEVHALTGRPISAWQQQFDRAVPVDQCRVFVLDWPRPLLYARINQRVVQMFADGLIEEVQGLIARGTTFSHTAGQALGYREVLEHLAGQTTLAQTIERVQARTRALARRQLTWFRSLSECRWVPLDEADTPSAIAERILRSDGPERAPGD